MDLIYKRARLTVIVLGDICMDTGERAFLEGLGGIHTRLGMIETAVKLINLGISFAGSLGPLLGDDFDASRAELQRLATEKEEVERIYREHHRDPTFRSFLIKLLSAEWFTRAWCWHEFRLNTRHVFYVGCDNGKVLRFTGPFMWELMSISLRQQIYSSVRDDQFRSDILENLVHAWAFDQGEGRFIRTQNDKQSFYLDARKIQSSSGGQP
jgi:hypothetical protein